MILELFSGCVGDMWVESMSGSSSDGSVKKYNKVGIDMWKGLEVEAFWEVTSSRSRGWWT